MGLEKDSFINERLRNDPSLLDLTKSILTEFDEVWDAASTKNRNLTLQQAIQIRVVDAIEYCQA